MKLWTIQEVVDLTGFSLWKVKKAIYKLGTLKVHRVGGSVRIRHNQLVEWLGFDPLDEPRVEISISKTVKTKDRTVTTTTRIEKPSQLSLFDK